MSPAQSHPGGRLAAITYGGGLDVVEPEDSHVISGRYSLDHEIGRGATGAVWLGRDEVLGRPVALKRIGLLPGAESTDLARAEREAQLSARLHHPHVVGVFDAVVDPENQSWWLVMEYVDGVDLGCLVRERGPLSPDEAAPLIAQAADALAAAHAAGIVHRDVKPSNILLDHHQQVKLTDFGIARIMSDPALTQTGLLTGSPAYLAPELIEGRPSGQASDVWSLGATLFHVLAGQPPYPIGENVVGGLYRIVHEDPPHLAEAGWLRPVLEATLVRDPDRRWSMSQVRAYLTQGATAYDAPPAAPDATATQALATSSAAGSAAGSVTPPRPRRRPSAKVLLAAVAVVLLLAVGGVVAHLRSGDAPSAADHPSSTATSTAHHVTGPTRQGMESFIRSYVTTVADDPSRSWMMLSPKFQQESGGFVRYSKFWDRATHGRVLSISADPKHLTVAYQVHFDDFHNGPGPTVLDLRYDDGHYLIDGEHSDGFKPAKG